MEMRFSLKGLQETQQAMLKKAQAIRKGTAIKGAVRWGTAAAHRAAIPSTPWDTAALRNAHRMRFEGQSSRGIVHIDQGAVNPRGQRPARYGPQLHKQGMIPGVRGGIRAFYEYTVRTFGPRISKGMVARFIKSLLRVK